MNGGGDNHSATACVTGLPGCSRQKNEGAPARMFTAAPDRRVLLGSAPGGAQESLGHASDRNPNHWGH